MFYLHLQQNMKLCAQIFTQTLIDTHDIILLKITIGENLYDKFYIKNNSN